MRREVYLAKRRGIAGLVRSSEELPPPATDELQISVRAIGLNFADVFSVLGLYAAAPKRPFVPGLEYSGVVEAIGAGVREFSIGDRVMGVTRFGAFATALNVDARFVRKLPEGWSFEEGAAHLVASLTAYYGLVDQCRLAKGETVLVHSAAGGVGLAALSIAKKFECFVIGSVGSESKREFCLAQGFDKVIVRGGDFGRDLDEALIGKKLDVVMDSIGGRIFRESFARLAARGRVAVYGYAEFMPHGPLSYPPMLWRYFSRPKLDTFRLENRTVAGFNLIYLFDHAELIRRYAGEIETLGIDKPSIGKIGEFANLPAALLELRSGATVGKIIIRQ